MESVVSNIEELIKEAGILAGRDVEVDKTTDGKFVVLYLNFTSSPPPKGDTPEEAVQKFIAWKKENTNVNGSGIESEDPDIGRDLEEVTGPESSKT